MGVSWTNLSHEGRALRRVFDKLYKKSLKNENSERLIKMANSMCQISLAMCKLVEIVDHDKRLTKIEDILAQIPPDVLKHYTKSYLTENSRESMK